MSFLSVAKRVAERGHSVENQNLKASLFEPPKQPPCYDDRVLIKGLNPSTTQDCLFNFIEAKSGLIPDKLDYHAETEGVAMVTFQMGQGDKGIDQFLYDFDKTTFRQMCFIFKILIYHVKMSSSGCFVCVCWKTFVIGISSTVF